MPLPAVGSNVLVTFEGRLAGQITLSTFWYNIASLGSAANLSQFYNDVNDQVQDADGLADKFALCCPADWAFLRVWVQVIYPIRYAAAKFVNGDIGGDGEALAANHAAVILRRGDLANRKNVSTLHVPLAVVAENVEDGILKPGGVKVKLVDLAVALLQPISLAGSTPGRMDPIVTNPRNGTPPTEALLTQAAVMDTARVMRRRTVGLGI